MSADLDLMNLGVISLPAFIEELDHVVRLDLDHNKLLTQVPMHLPERLEKLNVRNCNVKSLSDVGHLAKLKVLDLRGNLIQTIAPGRNTLGREVLMSVSKPKPEAIHAMQDRGCEATVQGGQITFKMPD